MKEITVHQIWLGDMPGEIEAMVAEVRMACYRQGIPYTMHGPEVLETHGTDAQRRALDRLRDFLPVNIWRVVVSDWARWRILGAGGEGTLYLDTDCRLPHGVLPVVELECLGTGLQCMPEGWNPSLTSSGCMYARGAAGAAVAALAGAMAGGRLEGQLDISEDELREQWGRWLRGAALVQFLGPGWLRAMVTPQAAERGLGVRLMPQELASCRNRHAQIYHEGVGSWLKRG